MVKLARRKSCGFPLRRAPSSRGYSSQGTQITIRWCNHAHDIAIGRPLDDRPGEFSHSAGNVGQNGILVVDVECRRAVRSSRTQSFRPEAKVPGKRVAGGILRFARGAIGEQGERPDILPLGRSDAVEHAVRILFGHGGERDREARMILPCSLYKVGRRLVVFMVLMPLRRHIIVRPVLERSGLHVVLPLSRLLARTYLGRDAFIHVDLRRNQATNEWMQVFAQPGRGGTPFCRFTVFVELQRRYHL